MNFTLHYETFTILLVAFLLGAIIGYERQYRQRTADCAPIHWLLLAPPFSCIWQ